MDRWVRSLRRAKVFRSSDRPLGVVHERERRLEGAVVDATTVFLAGAECPFSCVFCDLWTHTLTERTPPGALPRQLAGALDTIGQRSLIKLYNASNFFDPTAVPPADEAALLRLLDDFAQVTVECHPRFIGDRCFSFADRLQGTLEVAVGLETVHPEALPRLNKQMTLADFDAAASALATRQIGLRAFVLLGCPFVADEEQLDWTLRSVLHAAGGGAGTISIIPVRGGNGALESLGAEGHWHPVTLGLVEEAFDQALRLKLDDAVVQVDLWDLKRVSDCDHCAEARVSRLAAMNLSGLEEPRVGCDWCGASRQVPDVRSRGL
jgi:archaeosine synthase beta-subunit